MARVVHFEILADDPMRASEFYKNIFGWEFKKWDGPMDYWMITTGDSKEPGIDGGLVKKSDALNMATNTIDVKDIDECIEKIVDAGGKIITPKRAIPGVGYMAVFKDMEGNVLGLMESDETAE